MFENEHTAKNEVVTQAILDLYKVTNRLEELYPGRHFTLDGHLVGSIGEVYAADRYGIELFPASSKAHDGTAPDGRLVQIKATQRTSVGINEKPDFLIVLSINEKGELDEVYNGPGEPVWSLFENKKRPKNGQYQISLAKLRKLNEEVSNEDRIPSAMT